MKSIKAIITLALAALCSCAFAQNYVKLEVVEDGGTGPYKAIMLEEPSLEAHTILRPADLKPFNADNPLPVLVWGNGACTNSPWEHINFLSEIASHGFIVVATGFIPLNGERYRGPQSTSEQQIEGIDWVFKVNEDPSSPYYQKLDTKNIALAGMSCGGLQTLDNCQDPRLKAIMICNSGLFSDPSTAVPGMPMPAKEKLLQIHTPVMYLLGGPEDIAYANGMDDFNRINHVPAFAANYPVGHGGTYAQPHGGEFAVIATAWLEWQLKGDPKAGAMFLGNPCGVARREGWTADKKNID